MSHLGRHPLTLLLIAMLMTAPAHAQQAVEPTAAAAVIQTWHDEVNAYYQLLERYRGTQTGGQTAELRRSDRFYPIHRRALLDSRIAAQNSARVDGAAYDKLARGMRDFRAKHTKIIDLLNKLQAAETAGKSSADRARIVAQIKPYYRMRLFSALKPNAGAAASILPPKLPKGHVIEAGKEWVGQITKEHQDEARKADCSCKSIKLARVTAYTFTGSGLDRSVKRIYDIWDKANPPQSGPFTVPVLTHRRSLTSLNLPHTEQVCFYFTFPKALAFMRREGLSHPCDTKVELKIPHTRPRGGYYYDRRGLYSVTGSGGTMYAGKVYSAATDGRKLIRNQMCMIVVQQGQKIGPAGKKGHIRWSIRRAAWLKGGYAQQQCGTVQFTMK